MEMAMTDMQFLVDSSGRKTAVVIDLEKYGDIWEDFYDILLAHQRRDEPRESLEEVKKRLLQQGKLKTNA